VALRYLTPVTPTSPEAGASERIAQFISHAAPPAPARARALHAVIDTIGVALAGSSEECARIVHEVLAQEGAGPCRVMGPRLRVSAGGAALANGTAAHALDYDDMCFVSLAHPSAPLVAAALAVAELTCANGTALLDAYVVGFELEARLGRVLNPRHYQRGWHCTSTLGALGAAAAVSRLLALDAGSVAHALGIAASMASGLKQNFGSMVKPLHAGLAARNGVMAGLLASGGMTASPLALEGPQGYLAAFDAERGGLEAACDDLGAHWELLATGVAVKLYPSCAATHPALDALLELRREHTLTASDIQAIEVHVDSVTPTVLIHDRPSDPLQAKFSMPFCLAAAIVDGHVGLDTFSADRIRDARIGPLLSRIVMRADAELDGLAEPMTQVRLRVALRDGRTLRKTASGARGQSARPASESELEGKFLACAQRVLSETRARDLLGKLRALPGLSDVRAVLGD
jgi:2-methylcitrate dehydratase PrpD